MIGNVIIHCQKHFKDRPLRKERGDMNRFDTMSKDALNRLEEMKIKRKTVFSGYWLLLVQ